MTNTTTPRKARTPRPHDGIKIISWRIWAKRSPRHPRSQKDRDQGQRLAASCRPTESSFLSHVAKTIVEDVVLLQKPPLPTKSWIRSSQTVGIIPYPLTVFLSTTTSSSCFLHDHSPPPASLERGKRLFRMRGLNVRIIGKVPRQGGGLHRPPEHLVDVTPHHATDLAIALGRQV